MTAATPGHFRLRPFTVEAVQWTGENLGEVYELTGCENFDVLDEHDRANCDDPEATATVFARLHNSTWKLVKTGQWIIKGRQGEFFPLPDETFRDAYEDAAQERPAAEVPEARTALVAAVRELIDGNCPSIPMCSRCQDKESGLLDLADAYAEAAARQPQPAPELAATAPCDHPAGDCLDCATPEQRAEFRAWLAQEGK